MVDFTAPHLVRDISADIATQIAAAYHGRGDTESLCLGGSASRAAFGLADQATLPLAGHTGVVDYQPEELILRARAGTPLSEIEALLGKHNQRFAAEIPSPSADSTLGGAIACGWDGPGRAFGGALRDIVLGCQLVNGRGETVRFGGQVMKNVAGYDLARLQVGALGTLGAILDVTLRLQPQAECTKSVRFEVAPAGLHDWWQRTRALRPLLSGTCYFEGHLHLRFSGRERAVNDVLKQLGGEESGLDWRALMDLRPAFFHGERLACAYLPRYASLPLTTGQALVEWEGARVWVRDGDHLTLARDAAELGGFVRVMRGPTVSSAGTTPAWHRALKSALDPKGVFNPAYFERHFVDEGGA
uniref:FAD-binding protein n=1 Tax=Microbulbifer agarilyticus TaxID=260552 RepID=UPI0002559797|nr:FAD-binding protein [Microbulbifer agarilyticus]